MSPVHLRNLGVCRNQPEEREGLSTTRRPGRGHLGHSGGWKDTEGNNTHSAIHFTIQQKPQTGGLEGYGSSSSAPPTPQRSFPMENGQNKVQPSIPQGRTLSKFPEDISQRDRLQNPYGNHQRLQSHQEVHTLGGEGNQDKGESRHYASYRRTADPGKENSYSLRLTMSRPNQLSSGFTPFNNQQNSDQDSPLFTIPGSFQENTRIQGQKQELFQPKAERVRPNDPEAIAPGERSTQKPEIAVNTSRIRSPTNRNITPPQTEHNVFTPESNLNNDKLWLQMFQFAVQTEESLDSSKRLNEILQRNAILQEATIKAIQEV
ncbi:hypothetical protein O181_053996 [Austropuccinia psidii MF-1]|uniref:Uncharacterized protein n=1 Tax=Austropuccinia psidii MF-1 TaxID=1389203 RepID=A0A9Q3E8K9_9BASI|nr:hypothetical protein [Austropuccinia psidii MF-1]